MTSVCVRIRTQANDLARWELRKEEEDCRGRRIERLCTGSRNNQDRQRHGYLRGEQKMSRKGWQVKSKGMSEDAALLFHHISSSSSSSSWTSSPKECPYW